MPKAVDDADLDSSSSEQGDVPAPPPDAPDAAKANDAVNGDSDDEAVEANVVDNGAEGSESESDSDDDDEYHVETIRGHKMLRGKIHYEIKWQGYPEEENTWEPEANLSHASNILTKYFDKIGGRPSKNPRQKNKSGSAAQRQSGEAPAAKRQKQNGAGDDSGTWTPAKSDWEDLVVRVETVERGENGQLVAYILFKNGKKTKVSMDKVYRHCPRPMLRFYEDHLKFKYVDRGPSPPDPQCSR